MNSLLREVATAQLAAAVFCCVTMREIAAIAIPPFPSVRTVSAEEASALFGSACDYTNITEMVAYCGNKSGEECGGKTCGQPKLLIDSGTTHYKTATKICGNYSCCDFYPQGLQKCGGGGS